MNQLNKNKLLDTDNRLVVPRGVWGEERAEWVQGVECMTTDGK